MMEILKIALRNLTRQKRRTLLTLSLIVLGVVAVLLFIGVVGSFKKMMVAQITDSMMGHIQIHKKGYVESIDNLPLTVNMDRRTYESISKILDNNPAVGGYSPRIKFGGMLSNFVETTGIRLNGVNFDREMKTVPLLSSRILDGKKTLERGEIWVPEILAKGMNLKVGSTVVVIATNKDGSVNGKQFVVSGVLESATGPGGRDGYVTLEDAMEILRMEEITVSEIALRLKDFTRLKEVNQQIARKIGIKTVGNDGALEIHSWEKLSPFANIARMIDLMSLFIKLIMVAIVLVSIMNVMMMSVYERISEIGTIAAIGTTPKKILLLFLMEGLLLGTFGSLMGVLMGAGGLKLIKILKISYDFGRTTGIILLPSIGFGDLLGVSAIVLLVSLLASFFPSLKASKMEPVEALRHV